MLNLSGIQGRHKEIRNTPEMAQCPRCETWVSRNEIRTRRFWDVDLRQTQILDYVSSCFVCPHCPQGERWFSTLPEYLAISGQYSPFAREFVVSLIKDHKMSIENATEFARTKLHLTVLHPATVIGWLRNAGDSVDMNSRKNDMAAVFSGQVTVDEVYDGGFYQLKATDPLNDLELAYEVGDGSPDKQTIIAFFEKLKSFGINPLLVNTDGSELYPDAIATVWPEAKHQRCVFHFLKQLNKELADTFWAIYNKMPAPPKRGRGRPKKRGRPRKDEEKRENRLKVRLARFIIFKRETREGEKERWSERERNILEEAMTLCPQLRVLRRLLEAFHELFGPTTTTQEIAQRRRLDIVGDPEFGDLPNVLKSLDKLCDDDLFARLTRYLDFDFAEKTTNHVERENREYRKRQKAHYRLRSRASICALLNLLTIRKPLSDEPLRLKPKPQTATTRKAVSKVA